MSKTSFLKKLFKAAARPDPMDTEVLKERRAAHDAIIILQRQSGIVTGFIARKDGTHERFLEGELHCDDGPAIEKPDGTKMWFRKGKLHRDDGPAIEGPNGRAEYWENGEPVHAPQQLAPPPPPPEDKAAKMQAAIDSGLEQPVTISRPLTLRKPHVTPLR